MASRRKAGLDVAFQALSDHVLAIRERQEQNTSRELDAADLMSVLRAADALRAIEFDRLMIVVRLARHRLPSMEAEELKELISQVNPAEVDGETADAC